MGRWSRLIAVAFLEWLSPRPDLHWLEIGCGTGALSKIILSHGSPASLLAIDPSAEFIEFARRTVPDPRITFQVGDALNLPPIRQSMNVAVSGLTLNFISEPITALQMLRRALRLDGILAFYVWDYGGKMEMLRYFWDCAIALDHHARSLDEGLRFPMCQPDAQRGSRLRRGRERDRPQRGGGEVGRPGPAAADRPRRAPLLVGPPGSRRGADRGGAQKFLVRPAFPLHPLPDRFPDELAGVARSGRPSFSAN